MRNRTIKIIEDRVERDFLPFVRKPSRYIGSEVNMIKKDLSSCHLTFALCFPDIYEVGMSYTGMAVIYDILNHMPGVAAERAFAPWLDAEQIMREKNIPLFTLESKAAAGDFDIIGFSLTTELCYTTALNMIDLAGLAVRSADRSQTDPIIIAGGGMTNCCEPVAEFFDIMVLGEAEEAIIELVNLVGSMKDKGASKKDTLCEVAKCFSWAYVPSLYRFEYNASQIKSFSPIAEDLPERFENAVVQDFDNAHVPLRPIVPYAQTVHDRVSVEIMRGCPGRCRFCQAGFCRRPVRHRSVQKILEIAKAGFHATGFDTLSLLSLSTADYPDLEELVFKLREYFEPKYVGISLPSLRVDQQLKLLPGLVNSVRKSGLTIAVEAASEKLRQVINKPLTDENLFAAVNAAYQAGWQKIKLYFMVGFPGETENDITRIVDLSHKLAALRKEVDGKFGQINVAVSWLVPKAHTPFGFLSQKSGDYFENARQLIINRKKMLRAWFLSFKFHTVKQSILESAIGRGDRRMGDIIHAAWKKGAKFDLWTECFDYSIWKQAFADYNADPDLLAQQGFTEDQILPWQHLGGPNKEALIRHLDSALAFADARS
ncbi:MAG: TIGR03960 family B12-binding radical SAM protein [Planctomycetota bacterium]